MTHQTTQSTVDEGVANLVELLEFVRSEWNRFTNSKQRTMRTIKVPASIQFLVLRGKEYKIKGKREVWFKRAGSGYDPNVFYLCEAVDGEGHTFQLEIDLTRGSAFDEELVRMKSVGEQQVSRIFAGTGPRVRE